MSEPLVGLGGLSGLSGLGALGMCVGEAGESGETLLLADDDTRLADIIEGASWSSADSDPIASLYCFFY